MEFVETAGAEAVAKEDAVVVVVVVVVVWVVEKAVGTGYEAQENGDDMEGVDVERESGASRRALGPTGRGAGARVGGRGGTTLSDRDRRRPLAPGGAAKGALFSAGTPWSDERLQEGKVAAAAAATLDWKPHVAP